jgi:PhnB protein
MSSGAAVEKFGTAILPNLSVRNGAQAVEFYKRAFGATEVFLITSPDGHVVAQLAIDGAQFLLADESPAHGNFSPQSLGGSSVRIDLLVADPDAVQKRAIDAGAKEVFPVADQDFGYRMGRIVDPFGHHWLIGRPLAAR